MKLIRKNIENPILEDFKNWILHHTKNGDMERWFEELRTNKLNIQDLWDKLRKKDTKAWENLRLALLHEQGFLCAYCCCAIDMKEQKENNIVLVRQITVEHLNPKSENSKQVFDYDNLVACDKICNQNRGHNVLIINPLEDSLVKTISPRLQAQKTKKGQTLVELESENSDIQNDIENILKLNRQDLNTERGKVCEKVDKYASEYFNVFGEDVSKNELQKEFCSKKNGKYQPFSFVADWYIEKEISNKNQS